METLGNVFMLVRFLRAHTHTHIHTRYLRTKKFFFLVLTIFQIFLGTLLFQNFSYDDDVSVLNGV